MRILVVGSGGREHALAWKLAQEAEVMVTPGNAGTESAFRSFKVKADDAAGILTLCSNERIDLVVVGPEDPLIAGLADVLRKNGIAVFGPGAEAAQLEGSKAFSKSLMEVAGVPTSPYQSFQDAELALNYAESRFAVGRQVVVKASGNALGKGVVVCSTLDEAEDAIQSMLVDRIFGDACSTIVVEDRLMGYEFSLMGLVIGEHWSSLPIARDYKRALDGDRGPNTGGMGTVSRPEWLHEGMVQLAQDQIIRPTLAELSRRGIDYRGALFAGILVQEGQPYCLEFNCRFGDPETQSVMRCIGKGFADALLAVAHGHEIPAVGILPHAAATVVMASGGYPGHYAKGLPITLPSQVAEEIQIFHAGTATKEGALVTSGGRVLGVSSTGDDLATACERAYSVVEQIQFEGAQFRRDIGKGL